MNVVKQVGAHSFNKLCGRPGINIKQASVYLLAFHFATLPSVHTAIPYKRGQFVELLRAPGYQFNLFLAAAI